MCRGCSLRRQLGKLASRGIYLIGRIASYYRAVNPHRDCSKLPPSRALLFPEILHARCSIERARARPESWKNITRFALRDTVRNYFHVLLPKRSLTKDKVDGKLIGAGLHDLSVIRFDSLFEYRIPSKLVSAYNYRYLSRSRLFHSSYFRSARRNFQLKEYIWRL